MSLKEKKEYINSNIALNETISFEDGILYLPEGVTMEQFAQENNLISMEECFKRWDKKYNLKK